MWCWGLNPEFCVLWLTVHSDLLYGGKSWWQEHGAADHSALQSGNRMRGILVFSSLSLAHDMVPLQWENLPMSINLT